MRKRRYVVLAPEQFRDNAKTAHGVIRYGSDEIAAVVDPALAGQRVRDAVPYLDCDAPILASVNEALALRPNALLVGTAPKGGALPPSWRGEILAALDAGVDVVSGLHELLARDEQFARVARERGAKIWDVREPPDVPLFCGDVYGVRAPVLLAVGNDCAVGKMTVMLEFARAAQRAGTRAEFVPTGQTGIMIAGWGISIDRVIADFSTGAAEQLVLQAASRDPDFILVEGQGAINHPAYAPVTLALLYGCAPDDLLLVCDVRRSHIETYGTPTLRYADAIRIHEELCATVKPARVAGIALNTFALSDDAARAEVRRAREETGLPADDLVRFGADDLWNEVAARLVKRAPLSELAV